MDLLVFHLFRLFGRRKRRATEAWTGYVWSTQRGGGDAPNWRDGMGEMGHGRVKGRRADVDSRRLVRCKRAKHKQQLL